MVSVASIFGILCIAMGGILFVYLLLTRHLAVASRSWPSVPGVITSSRKQKVKDDEGDICFYPKVEYEYVVNGVTHTSDVIKFGAGSDNEISADRVLSRYQAGSMVIVRHHPRRPALSVLEPGGLSVVDLAYFLFACFFLSGGVAFILP